MASEASRGRHLDATDREVVYCHACCFEWYRDEFGILCPSCQSDVTEVVSMLPPCVSGSIYWTQIQLFAKFIDSFHR